MTANDQLDLLCGYTREVLDHMSGVIVPVGCTFELAADSDVFLGRPDRAWVGLRLSGATQTWRQSRGVLTTHASFATLQEAVDHFAKAPWPMVLCPMCGWVAHTLVDDSDHCPCHYDDRGNWLGEDSGGACECRCHE